MSTTDPFSVNNQKGFALILILVIIVVILAVAGGAYYYERVSIKPQPQNTVVLKPTPIPTPDPTANWQTYTNNLGFSLKYPTDYKYKEFDVSKLANIPTKKYIASVSFLSDSLAKNMLQLYPDYMSSSSAMVPENSPLIDVYEAGGRGLDQVVSDFKDGIKTTAIQRSFISESKVLVDKVEGVMLVDQEASAPVFYDKFIFLKKGEAIYELNLASYQPDTIQLKTFDQMISTFKFVN